MLGHSSAIEQIGLHASDLMTGLAVELTGITADDPQAAQWIVHLVLSMAYLPLGDAELEREMLQRFVAPAFA